MSFSDYRNYSSTELETIFNVEIIADGDLFGDFKSSGRDYSDLQAKVDLMESRISISTDAGNEATRSHLLVSHTLWESVADYDLGIFFEPPVEISPEETPDLPHPLNGKYDCGLNLNKIDFVSPIISVLSTGQKMVLFCNTLILQNVLGFRFTINQWLTNFCPVLRFQLLKLNRPKLLRVWANV
ncbi:hypothetical protein BGP_4200 [Beggiatoa sp. PS]|nr:hypothetical protein BGP_4200 [Beggiatoa sp. PS]